MSETTKYEIGDKILYKGNSSVIWIIESIGDGKVYCSAMKPNTVELVYCEFSITSIQKLIPYTPTVFKKVRNNHF